MHSNTQTTLRIIGGKWRGRKIKVAQAQDIRPTTDFIRETVFNWLAPVIQDANCLDMFAGSGALGFEALSRGAKHVTFMDQSKQVITTLQENAKIVGTTNITFWCQKFTPDMPNPWQQQFDIIFLDPPFHKDLINPCSQWLEQNNCCSDDAYIYIEAEKSAELELPENWHIHRQKTTGQVLYTLVRRCST